MFGAQVRTLRCVQIVSCNNIYIERESLQRDLKELDSQVQGLLNLTWRIEDIFSVTKGDLTIQPKIVLLLYKELGLRGVEM